MAQCVCESVCRCACMCACLWGSLFLHLSLGGGAEQCCQLSIAPFNGQIKRRSALLCVCAHACVRACVRVLMVGNETGSCSVRVCVCLF